jgi:hypothetical protein
MGDWWDGYVRGKGGQPNVSDPEITTCCEAEKLSGFSQQQAETAGRQKPARVSAKFPAGHAEFAAAKSFF